MIKEQNINQLPKDWKWVKLGEVCDKILGGGTPSTKVTEYWQGDIPWISSADIEGLREINPRRKISIEAVKKSAANILPKGGIIVVTRVGLGKLAIAPYDICFSQDSQGLILHDKLITKSYALIYLSKAVQKFKQESRGTTINGVTKKQLTELRIPLPPKPIQQAIVSKLEELFSELDKGIEQLKIAQQQLKTYRQSVLKCAFEGKLTNSLNYDSYDLLDEHDLTIAAEPNADYKTKNNQGNQENLINQGSDKGELPKGWKWVKLGEVSKLITKGASPKWQGINYVDDSSQVLFVTSENVRENYIDISTPKYLEISFNEKQKRSVLKKGDVLLNIVGASIGRAAIYNLDFNANINQAVCVIRLSSKIIEKFVSYYLNSNKALSYYNLSKVDVARANLSLADVGNIQLALPPIELQNNIVQEIESRLSVADKMEESINQSLQQAEALRQSILKKAFEGRLV